MAEEGKEAVNGADSDEEEQDVEGIEELEPMRVLRDCSQICKASSEENNLLTTTVTLLFARLK